MKFYIVFLLLFFSTNSFATRVHTCTIDLFTIFITTEKENDISLEIFKAKRKIAGCNLKVITFEDGKKSVSTNELIRFEKRECNILYDKIASKVNILNKGFLKTSFDDKKSYAYIIKNEQPLKCQYK